MLAACSVSLELPMGSFSTDLLIFNYPTAVIPQGENPVCS